MNNERDFESGKPRTESAKQESYQSAKAQETAGEARPQEDREKTAKAIHAARQQLANEPDPAILAIILPISEKGVPPVPAESPSAIDMAGQIVDKVIERIIKTAKAVAKVAKGVFDKREGKAA